MNIFGIDSLKQEIESLKRQLREKEEVIVQQNITIVKLNSSFEKLKPTIEIITDIYKTEQSLVDLHFNELQQLWAKWPLNLHNETPQLERQKRAASQFYTPVSLSPSHCTGKFRGNEQSYYTPSLLKCDCQDFRRRLKPCKHMYRLAYEFDIFMIEDVQEVPDPTKLLTLQEVKDKIKALPSPVLQLYAEVLFNEGTLAELRSSAKKLISSGLVECSTDKHAILNEFTKDDLFSKLPSEREEKIPKGIKKADLITKIIASYPQIVDDISKYYTYLIPSPEFSYLNDGIRAFVDSLNVNY